MGVSSSKFKQLKSNEIIEFDPANKAWIVRDEKLVKGRQDFAAFLIPDNVAECGNW